MSVVMSAGNSARVSGAGRDGLRAVRPAASQPQPPAEGQRMTMAADRCVRVWEAAYRQYGHASEILARSPENDPAAAWAMATASWEVAEAWRGIAAVSRLPWWTLAAVESAAEAFEAQARDWEAREQGEDYGEDNESWRGAES